MTTDKRPSSAPLFPNLPAPDEPSAQLDSVYLGRGSASELLQAANHHGDQLPEVESGIVNLDLIETETLGRVLGPADQANPSGKQTR